jgi:hypothetical protein
MKENSTIGHYNILRQLGAKLWLPQLKAAGFEAVLSGHTHRARHDAPTAEMPVHQFVGGGPKPEQATLTIIDAALANGKASMQIQITNLQSEVLFKEAFALASLRT